MARKGFTVNAPLALKRRRKGTGRIHVWLSRPLHARLLESVKRDGYSPRQVSLWIQEALTRLEEDDPMLQRATVGDAREENSYRSTVSLAYASLELLDEISGRVIGVDRSMVVRSAIRFRLEHSSLFTRKPS